MKYEHRNRIAIFVTSFFFLLALGWIGKLNAQSNGKLVFPWKNGSIFVKNVGDTSPPDLVISGVAAYETRWSPNGSKILFEGNAGLNVINANGTGLIMLTNSGLVIDSQASWSSDGSKIVFMSNRNSGDLEIYTMNADGTNQVRRTNSSGRDAYPAWSPNGNKIVFASERGGGKYQLYTMNTDGTNPTLLANLSGDSFKPIWSPNGSMVAFARIEMDKGCQKLYKINSDGTGLLALSGEICDLNRIMWLPDSSRILYQEHSNIYSVNPDGSNASLYLTLFNDTDITNGFDLFLNSSPPPTATPGPTSTPAPSSSGLLGQYYDNSDLTNRKLNRVDAVVDFNWGSGSPHASIGVDTFSVRWTGQVVPQYSQTYTFYTQSDDGVRLWVNGQLVIDNWTNHSSVENSGTIALTAGVPYDLRLEYYDNNGSSVIKLSWSSSSQSKQVIPTSKLKPNGRIAFTTDRDGNNEIYLMNPDGAQGIVNLTNNSAAEGGGAAAVGTYKTAFDTNRTGNSEIYSLSQGVATNLTNNSSFDAYASQGPDGRIVFASTRGGGNFNLWVMNADGTGVTQLTTSNPGAERHSGWSPDGLWIVYEMEDGSGVKDLWKIPSAGGTPVRLTQNTGSNFEPEWSPDGTTIVFRTNRTGASLLYLMNADGSNQRSILPTGTMSGFAPSWSPDGTQVAFHSWKDGSTNPEVYVLTLGSTTATRLTNNTATDGSVSWAAQ